LKYVLLGEVDHEVPQIQILLGCLQQQEVVDNDVPILQIQKTLFHHEHEGMVYDSQYDAVPHKED
jgi:hypothetical protein